jgi:hypothetical protein
VNHRKIAWAAGPDGMLTAGLRWRAR